MQTLKEFIFKQESEFKEYVGKGIDPQKQQQLHDDIVSGKIDIGPMPDHSAPVEDKRPGIAIKPLSIRLPKDLHLPSPKMLDGLAPLIPSEVDRNGDLNH